LEESEEELMGGVTRAVGEVLVVTLRDLDVGLDLAGCWANTDEQEKTMYKPPEIKLMTQRFEVSLNAFADPTSLIAFVLAWSLESMIKGEPLFK